MEFLKKCQEWMAVNVTKAIQAGTEEGPGSAESDSAKRLLRGESRDTLLSSENTDEDSECFLLRSRENLDQVEAVDVVSCGDMDIVYKEALINPDMILWHPPSAEFKVTVPVRNGILPFNYIVKKSADSDEYYFLVCDVDQRSTSEGKLLVGDWLQSVTGDRREMIALTSHSSKYKFEGVVLSSDSVTIIFQRPKCLLKNPGLSGDESSLNHRQSPSMRSVEHEIGQEKRLSVDVSHLDIDLSMESQCDKMAVNNLLTGYIPGEESFIRRDETQTGKSQKITVKPLRTHPLDRPCEKEKQHENAQVTEMPTFHACRPVAINRQKFGHRRVVSAPLSGIIRDDESSTPHISRTQSTCDLWGEDAQSCDENDFIVENVTHIVESCFVHMHGTSLERAPIITIVVSCPSSSDLNSIKDTFCDILGVSIPTERDDPFGLFIVTKNEEPLPYFNLINADACRSRLISNQTVKKLLNITEINHIILAKHCASQLREHSVILGDLNNVSKMLMESEESCKGIPLVLIGYFLCHPPPLHSNFMKLQLKTIKEKEFSQSGMHFSKHTIVCLLHEIDQDRSDPGSQLVKICNQIDLVQSFATTSTPVVLIGTDREHTLSSSTRCLNGRSSNHNVTHVLCDKWPETPLYFFWDNPQKESDDRTTLSSTLRHLFGQQEFITSKQNFKYPLSAVAIASEIHTLIQLPQVVTASRTQIKLLARQMFGCFDISGILKALHDSGVIINPDEIISKAALRPILDMFILINAGWISEVLPSVARDRIALPQNSMTTVSATKLRNWLSGRCIDAEERIAFMELLNVIYPVQLGRKPGFLSTNDVCGDELFAANCNDLDADRTLLIDFHTGLSYTTCLQILCNVSDNFEGETEFHTPLAATFIGSYEFRVEFCPWNSVGVIYVRLNGKKPWQFMEFIYNLLLCTSRKHKLMNVDYHIGPICPFVADGRCSFARKDTDKVHIIAIHGDSSSLMCGKNDLSKTPSIKEWLREIVYVQPYREETVGSHSPVTHTIELGMSLLQLPTTLFSLLCSELLIKDRWKSLAGSMGRSQHDVDLLTIHRDPVSTLFHQWAYTEEHTLGACSLGRLFHYFSTCKVDQFYDVKRRVKDWIEDNGYILTSSGCSKTPDKVAQQNRI